MTIEECRAESQRTLAALGEEPGMWDRFRGNPPPDYEPALVAAAIVDALTQEGVAAWPGDGVGCVEQIVRAYAEQAKRFKRSLIELQRQSCVLEADMKELEERTAPGLFFIELVKSLALTADKSPAKNYACATFCWDSPLLGFLPFHKIDVIFYRDGGKTQTEVVAELKARVAELEEKLESVEADAIEAGERDE